MYILTLNCGSSSVKYQLYNWNKKEVLAKGIVERVTVGDSFIKHFTKGKRKVTIKKECSDHRAAVKLIIDTLLDRETGALDNINDIKAVGHRVVHGGDKFAKSVIIDDAAMKAFKEMTDLSPLHNPANIMGIEAARKFLPNVPHCASLDTAWHQTMPKQAYLYALPYEWYTKYGIRRYGFHGTSFLYISKRASVLLGKDPFQTNLVCLHVGNGASANAVKNGISVETSMGMTPLEGLIMGTRAGDHDAAIDFYLIRKEHIHPDKLEDMLNEQSGLKGITGGYTDMRDIKTARDMGNERCQLAIDMLSYRLRKYIGAYIAVLGHVDAVVFTAGIGEMIPEIRWKALSGLKEFGIILDREKNELSKTRNAETVISTDSSKVKVFVIPTDEELVMTEDTYALLKGTYDIHTNFTYSFQEKNYVNKERAEAFQRDLKQKPELKVIAAPIT